MNESDRLLLIASLATVFAVVTKNRTLQTLSAFAGAAFALQNMREAAARALGD